MIPGSFDSLADLFDADLARVISDGDRLQITRGFVDARQLPDKGDGSPHAAHSSEAGDPQRYRLESDLAGA